jgi:hypothetical protein
MATKRKRALGGGRKPRGEFAGLTSPISIRMPPDLRAQLRAAARRSRRSVSQEAMSRLDNSLKKDRDKAADPAMRALNFLFSSLAYSVHWNMPNWRSNLFLFRAIKIGVGKLLDALEPSGEPKLPDFWRVFADHLNAGPESSPAWAEVQSAIREDILRAIASPEAMADYAAKVTLLELASPRSRNWDTLQALASNPDLQEIGRKILKHQEDLFYGMKDAKRDLAIKGEKS